MKGRGWDKSKLSETDICEKFISPALAHAGWDVIEQVLREVPLRPGRPPLAEQHRIVARVEELMKLCDAMEQNGRLADEQHARLTSTLFDALATSESAHSLAENWQRVAEHFDLLLDRPEAIDDLERTILQLAVRGLLVVQDSSDERAPALRERIHSERAALFASGLAKREKPLKPVDESEYAFPLQTVGRGSASTNS